MYNVLYYVDNDTFLDFTFCRFDFLENSSQKGGY